MSRTEAGTTSGRIIVDFMDRKDMPYPGRLGLTCAPGTGGGQSSARLRPDMTADLETLRNSHHADVLVTLQEGAELRMLGMAGLFAAAKRMEIESLWFPIPDGYPPYSLSVAASLIDVILERLQDGQTVVVHCYAGLGRTGTIVACVLVAGGMDARRAVQRVREVRPGAIPSHGQERFVHLWGEALNDASQATAI